MPAPPAKPISYWDLEPHPAANPSRRERRRQHRALRPGLVATVAVVAVAVASTVGTLVFGGVERRADVATGGNGAPAGVPAAEVRALGDPAAAPAVGALSAPATTPVSTSSPTAPTAPVTSAAAPPAPPAPPKAPPAKKTGADPSLETAVLTLVNQERAKANCQPFTADSRLATAARLHSEDMAARNFFAHTNPDGVSFDQRITKAGYTWSGAAENIAKGQTTPASVMDSWMNSPGHRANILNCGLKNIGVGVAYQERTPLWTQDFGSPRG